MTFCHELTRRVKQGEQTSDRQGLGLIGFIVIWGVSLQVSSDSF